MDESAPEGLFERTVIRSGRAPGPREAPTRWAYRLAYLPESGAELRGQWQLGASPLRIGRRAPCDVVLADDEVSSVHCEVRAAGGDVFVTDLGSTNGTFIDGRKVRGSARLRHGGVLELGRQRLRLEMREEGEFQRADEMDRDLERAAQYVRSLLPAPLSEPRLSIDWFFQPSLRVGGDGFGYVVLDDSRYALYIIDVSGHGVEAAMHLASVLNALRVKALPGADISRPGAVLAALNTMFPMERHGGMFFTIWYGILDVDLRTLTYASGGHHPAFAIGEHARTTSLRTKNPIIGAMPGVEFVESTAQLHAADRLYLFSDGVFEITTRNGTAWGLGDFTALLGRAAEGTSIGEAESLFRRVRDTAAAGALDDDFSLLVVTIS